jgi:hypothetical protein
MTVAKPSLPVLWFAVFAAIQLPVSAQNSRPTDYQVKAAYLVKFGKFVEYPAASRATADEKFNVCLLGQDPFGSVLDSTAQGETVAGAAVAARRITRIDEASGCRVLFIPASEDSKLKAIFAALDGAAVLTVSDMPGFTRRGGMVQFVIEGNRVHFEINLASARRSGLNLSSDLLKLAVAIRRQP